MFDLTPILVAAMLGGMPSDAPTDERVREAVQQSIPYIEEKGQWWIEKKDCVSCHRVNSMVWSLSDARKQGFEVSDQLDEWTKWATDASLAENDKGKVVGLGNKEGVAQILLSYDGDAKSENERKQLAGLLLNDQQSDGSWNPGGQLPMQKRPKPETASVSTMWLALALMKEGLTEEAKPVVQRALGFIEQSPAGKSTEWYAVQLLLAVERKDNVLRVKFLDELRKQQQIDGGWGWLTGEESDALGTGMAIYAMTRAGVTADDPAIAHARQFLVSTQRENGSWPVRGTKANKKEHIQETAVYWGTTWAALGLMAGLPEQDDQASVQEPPQ